MHLPACIVPVDILNKRYGLLDKQKEMEPLKSELAEFQSWLKAEVQLDRTGCYIAQGTVANIMGHVHAYLGFCYNHLSVSQPSLSAFQDLTMYIQFMSFQKTKGNTHLTLAQHAATARKVMQYLVREPLSQNEISSNVKFSTAAQKWLSRLVLQLSKTMTTHKDRTHNLPAAHEVVKMIEQFRLETMAALQGLPAAAEFSLDPREARQLHKGLDALGRRLLE